MLIRGTSGDDNLLGTVLSDIMEGFAGDDSFWGSAGADAIYGGDDVASALGDTVIYADSHAPVKIDCATSTNRAAPRTGTGSIQSRTLSDRSTTTRSAARRERG